MHSVWFRDCKTPEEKETRKSQLRSFKTAFKELSEVLQTLEEKPTTNYEDGSWPLRMAHINGANAKLTQVINLLNIKE